MSVFSKPPRPIDVTLVVIILVAVGFFMGVAFGRPPPSDTELTVVDCYYKDTGLPCD